MIKRRVIVAVAVISAISLIAGITISNGDILKRNSKLEGKNKAEVVKQYDIKKQKKISDDEKVTDQEREENKEKNKAVKNKTEESKKEVPEQITASQNLFYPSNHTINYPEPNNFGKYYDYAVDVYNYAVNGENVGELIFDNADDMHMFQSEIKSTVLNNSGIPLLEGFGHSYIIETGAGCKLKPMNLGHEEYVELKEIEDFILSICGERGVTDLELINNLNYWLKNNTGYDYSFRDISYSELGIVRNRSAVCDGYSDFVKRVCDMYGVPCEKVIGNVDEGLHAWNRIKIGGTWYYIDTTWNVCLGSNQYYLSRNLWSDHRL